jgi:hypothetical protein
VPNAATLIGFVAKARARRRETSSTMAPSNDSIVLSDIEISDPLVLQDLDSTTTWPKAAPIKFHSRFNRGCGTHRLHKLRVPRAIAFCDPPLFPSLPYFTFAA